MLKNVMATLFISSFLTSIAYGQSFLNPSAPSTGSRPMSAQEYKNRVNKISQQYDSSINAQVKQIMPKQPPPVAPIGSTPIPGQNVIAAPATPAAVMPAAPPAPPPPTSVTNQPAQYQPTTTFNPNASNSFAPTQAPQGAQPQPYTGFQSAPPPTRSAPAKTNPAPSWDIKY